MHGHRVATLWVPYDYRKGRRSFLGRNDKTKIARCPHDHLALPVRGSYDVTAMCLRATGLRFFNLSLCVVKRNRRGHDARKSVR